MSELDYEMEISSVEVTTNKEKFTDIELHATSENLNIENISQVEIATKNDICQVNPVDDGELISDSEKLLDSKKDQTDLEEGEISDSNAEESPDGHSVCRFFKNGTCHMGITCRFLHVGGSAYSMFDRVTPEYLTFRFVPQPQVPSVLNSWDKGLQEAKKLILCAKQKKEQDAEFEEKKLYMDIEEKFKNTRQKSLQKLSSTAKKMNNEHHAMDYKTDSKAKKKSKSSSQIAPSSQSWTDPWRRSRSRTRNRSRSSSTSSASYVGPVSSVCSQCSSHSENSRSPKKLLKSKSKLDRVFARTLQDSPCKRGRKYDSVSSSRSLSPLQKRSSKQYNKRKRSRCKSRSRSSSDQPLKKYSKKSFKKIVNHSPLPHTAKNVDAIKDPYKHHKSSYRMLKSSEESVWDSCSDLTISSITCTPPSDFKDDTLKETVKSPVKNLLASEENRLKSYFYCNFEKSNTNIDSKTNASSDSKIVAKSRIKSSPENHSNKISSTHKPENNSNKTSKPENHYHKKSNNPENQSEKKSSEVDNYSSKLKTLSDKKSNITENQFSKPGNHYESSKLKIAKEMNSDEMLLLSYASSGFRNNTPTDAKESLTVPAVRNFKKPISFSLKPNCNKLVETNEVLKTQIKIKKEPKIKKETLSRREHLLMQLRAVEMAIAKKKKLLSEPL